MVRKAVHADRANRILEAFRAAGIRVTPQRVAVYEEIAGTTVHPSVEWVYERLRERMPNVSLDTVYRAFRQFGEMGLIFRIDTGEGRARYDGNLDPHHHFICTRCGAVLDFWTTSPDAVTLPREATMLGNVESMRLEVKGICAACRRTEN